MEINNFKVLIYGLYRGSQPYTQSAWDWLKETYNIKTVLKLNYSDEGDDTGAIKAGMNVIECSMPPRDFWQAIGKPDVKDVANALKIMQDLTLRPLFVHCTHGQDRTGLICGEYRVLAQGWKYNTAYNEMVECGFHPELLDLLFTWHEFVKSHKESK